MRPIPKKTDNYVKFNKQLLA